MDLLRETLTHDSRLLAICAYRLLLIALLFALSTRETSRPNAGDIALLAWRSLGVRGAPGIRVGRRTVL
jgi:hypothetical protein